MWHHDNAPARVVCVATRYERRGLAVADHDIALASEQPIPVAIPAIRPFVRFEVVDRPDAPHAAAARGPKEPVQPQEMTRTARAARWIAARSAESSPPEAFRPVQVHPIDAATSSPEPARLISRSSETEIPRFARAPWHNAKYGFPNRVTPAGKAEMQKSRLSGSTAREDMNVADGANQTPGDQALSAGCARSHIGTAWGKDGLSVTQLTDRCWKCIFHFSALPSGIDA